MAKLIENVVGQKFGQLIVTKDLGRMQKDGGKRVAHYCICQCACGRLTEVDLSSLRSGNTKSCGHCTSSGGNLRFGRKLYTCYMDMRRRCYNAEAKNYRHYGGRGIQVCDEWMDPNEGFENFCKWSMNNGFSEELSLDRIDNDGNYSPPNCRWATKRVQNINKNPSKKNSSGYVGIRKHSSGVGWYGCVKINGKDFYTGYSKDLLEAVKMRNEYISRNHLENELNEVT